MFEESHGIKRCIYDPIYDQYIMRERERRIFDQTVLQKIAVLSW